MDIIFAIIAIFFAVALPVFVLGAPLRDWWYSNRGTDDL